MVSQTLNLAGVPQGNLVCWREERQINDSRQECSNSTYTHAPRRGLSHIYMLGVHAEADEENSAERLRRRAQ